MLLEQYVGLFVKMLLINRLIPFLRRIPMLLINPDIMPNKISIVFTFHKFYTIPSIYKATYIKNIVNAIFNIYVGILLITFEPM